MPTTEQCDLCFLYFDTGRGAHGLRRNDGILGGCNHFRIFGYEINVDGPSENCFEHDKCPYFR